MLLLIFLSGHETVGVVAAIGKDVKGFKVGERVVADNSVREFCSFGNRVRVKGLNGSTGALWGVFLLSSRGSTSV